jgi:hypothetical protein
MACARCESNHDYNCIFDGIAIVGVHIIAWQVWIKGGLFVCW